jgi:hypothetical protein
LTPELNNILTRKEKYSIISTLVKGKPPERAGRKTAGLSLERALDMVAGLPGKALSRLSSKRDYNKALLVPFSFCNSKYGNRPVYHSINYSVGPLVHRDHSDRICLSKNILKKVKG